MKESMWVSFWFIAAVTLLLFGMVFWKTDWILHTLQVPEEIYGMMRTYVRIIFTGLGFLFLYNYFAYLLRAVGNSLIPLYFLAAASLLNILLDLWFVIGRNRGVGGAAEATVIAQAVSGVGIAIYTIKAVPELRVSMNERRFSKKTLGNMARYSLLTCIQQSVMNFGILMIQGLVNSFGTIIMAAFAAAVKIDTLAYMPAQEFGNAFSMFIAQNYGAGEKKRIHQGIRTAVRISISFCLVISLVIFLFAGPLMEIFVDRGETEIIREGIRYLRIEGSFYWGIGCLFLLYGLYRGVGHPGMSLVLTVISLGSRVALSYALAPRPEFGVTAIWWSIPIGWMFADFVGFVYYKKGNLQWTGEK